MKTQILLLALLFATSNAQGMGAKSPVRVDAKAPCLEGTDAEKQNAAQQIFLSLVAETVPAKGGKMAALPTDEKMMAAFSKDVEGHFFHKLALEMQKHGCAFSDSAKFSSVGETIDSIAKDSYKISPNAGVPQWLKPGFKAVLGAYDNNNTIFIETTASGFIFHACEHDSNTPGNDAPAPTESCPTLFNKSLYVPVEELLQRTSGLKYKVLLVLKALAGTSVILTSNLGLGVVSPVAAAVVNLTNPDPLAVMKRDQTIGDATIAFLQLGAHSSALDDKLIVSRMLPAKYDDLKEALTDVVGQIFQSEYKKLGEINKHPENPNLSLMPAEQIETEFHERVQKEYEAAKSADGKPAPSESAPSTP